MRLRRHGTASDSLIEFGVFESGVADALCPSRDDRHPLLQRLRCISEQLGTAAAAEWWGLDDQARQAMAAAKQESALLENQAWPNVRLKTPEGYAYYSLYPEMYAEAVAAWAERTRPAHVVCLGLRNIGSSLSAIATGALRLRGVDVRSWTLRPRGHPFDRHVKLTHDLVTSLQLETAVVLIVDEGPGLSGSSLTGAASALAALGLPDDRIVFVPSWQPPSDKFVSSNAAARWQRHERVVPQFEEGVRTMLDREGIVDAGAIEISAGRWRQWLELPQPWPAAQPQHERRKFVTGDSIARFAGLGEYGCTSLERARQLSGAGWTQPPDLLRRGFLRTPVADGRPMGAGDVSRHFLSHAARYVAWLRTAASSTEAANVDALASMLRVNAREAHGDDCMNAVDALVAEARQFAEAATAIDGRLMPHEWIAGSSGWMKTDALDHHRDHFFPGCTDAAWDVAGLITEFALDDASSRDMVEEYARRSGDMTIARRLPFYCAAYSAFRCGYCSLAGQTLSGTEEAARFQRLDARYREALRATLASVPSAR